MEARCRQRGIIVVELKYGFVGAHWKNGTQDVLPNLVNHLGPFIGHSGRVQTVGKLFAWQVRRSHFPSQQGERGTLGSRELREAKLVRGCCTPSPLCYSHCSTKLFFVFNGHNRTTATFPMIRTNLVSSLCTHKPSEALTLLMDLESE